MILSGKRDHVTREVFIGIASYYDGHTKPREPVTSYDKRSVTQCLRMAQERGYVTHWGWDNIDNKSERRKGVQHGRRLSEIEGREDQA